MRHGAVSAMVIGVLAAGGAAGAQVMSFTSQSDFEAHMQSQGSMLLGVEDFEDFGLGDFEYLHYDAVSVVNTGFITAGFVPSADMANPFVHDIGRGTDVLTINGTAIAFGVPTSSLTTANGADGTTDLLFGDLSVVNDVATMNFEGRTGVGFVLLDLQTRTDTIVRVFGADGATLLAEYFAVEASAYPGSFFGVASDIPIGRVNLHNVWHLSETVDNVQMWVADGGCAADLDGNGTVDVFDLLAYLDLWFAADPGAELTGDDPASIEVFDLLAYLDGWFAGC